MPDMSDGHLTACTGRLICPAFWALQPAYKRKIPRADGIALLPRDRQP